MDDFLDPMTSPEIENYQLKKVYAVLKNLQITFLPPAAKNTNLINPVIMKRAGENKF